jgi:hypothetical protein
VAERLTVKLKVNLLPFLPGKKDGLEVSTPLSNGRQAESLKLSFKVGCRTFLTGLSGFTALHIVG